MKIQFLRVKIITIFAICMHGAMTYAHGETLNVTGTLKKGAPCYILVSSSGEIYSLKNLKNARKLIGKKLQISGNAMRFSNCMQGKTLQVTNFNLAE